MSSGMVKTTIREIKASFGRYLAILAIVMLGVGLFAGLKITKPAMITTQNAYLREQNFFDFRLLSTIGFTDDDLEKLSHMDEVADIEGTISLDALCAIGGENEAVYKIHALPEKINKIELTAGRMPQAENECVLDAAKCSIKVLGSAFTVTDDNDEDTLDMFRNRTYTVVGIARSPYYMNFERGTTSIGEGRVEAYAYVPMEAFDSEYLTEVFVTLNEKYDVYTDEYEDYVDAVQDGVEQKTEEVVDERYRDLIDGAQEKIDDAQTELDDKSAEAEEELDKAWQEILDGEAEIEEHEQEIADGKDQIAQARDTIKKQRAALDEQEEQLAAMEAMMASGQYGAGAQAGGGQFAAGGAKMQAGGGQFVADGAEMQAGSGQIAESGAQMQAYAAQLAESGAQMQAYAAQLAEGRAQIQAGREQLAAAEAELTSREAELAEGEEELIQARKDLEEGKAEYEDAQKEFEEEIADAQEKIDDARAELADIEQPDYYVLTRETNIGYACFDSDSSIVAAVANIFPVFFFLVAALICMTTMNRMVEEQRTQIGVLKALGYGNAAIMAKYMFYAGSAAIIGALTGLAGGTWLFPKTIWEGYKIMYDLGEITYLFNGWLAFFSVLAAVLCSMGAAYFSCRYELYSVPANLIRPKAPKSGKRIFLEKVTFIWKRLKFLQKVSARNLVRYKKRFIMMILGISGCAALLVAGFGIKDSVANIAEYQYGEIQIYDIGITYDEALTQAEMTAFTEQTADIFAKIAYRYEESVDIDFGEKTKSLYMVIPENTEEIAEFINLHTEQGEAIPYPAKGEAVITAKVAKNLGIRVGDEVVIRDNDMNRFRVKIAGLCENFVYNYIYINQVTYQDQIDAEPECKSAYAIVTEGTDLHAAAARVSDGDNVLAVSVVQDMKDRISTMMQSMDYIVALIILCAGCLAFIVLYNLTNINITERIREIATIKVLGFYAKETADYVFRENLILTGLGGAVGLVLGKLLHWFIMYNINIDMISFKNSISPLSYGLSFLLTFVFAMFVNGIMFFKLEKINMAESLKSIE
ncbi:MAG: FtsX-like permease family protein [Lachnospiraceae bacterium]|nr:FtsX-like permease family protein [Lachnospiraceae bacterium]